ncbi:MAG: glycine hydroxymethyltransferase [Cyclobacteriaceae bacterium]
MTVNKNMVPFDDKSPFVTSGIRVGSAAITSRGLIESDMERIVTYMDETLMNHENEQKMTDIRTEVNAWMSQFPLFKA